MPAVAKREKRVTMPVWGRFCRSEKQYSRAMARAREIGQVADAKTLYSLLGPVAAKEDQEVFYVVSLDPHLRIRHVQEVARGARDQVQVPVADTLRTAVGMGASAIVIAHNHPTGEPQPSEADKEMTEALAEAAQVVGIPLMDHLVLGLDEKFYSFAAQGLLAAGEWKGEKKRRATEETAEASAGFAPEGEAVVVPAVVPEEQARANGTAEGSVEGSVGECPGAAEEVRSAVPEDPTPEPPIPDVITHANMDALLDVISKLPAYQPGPERFRPPGWVHREVVLEVPLGELARGWLQTMALLGPRPRPDVLPLTGKEGFDAQGLEGKVQIRKDLFSALMNLANTIPVHRGRILSRG